MPRLRILPFVATAVLLALCESPLRSEDRNEARARSANGACWWAKVQLGREVQPCGTNDCVHSPAHPGEKACATPDPKPEEGADISADGHLRWYGYCARFVRMAYNQKAKYSSASELYEAVKDSVGTSSDIPVGALVFWKWKTDGHVGIYVGDGSVIHTGANARTKEKGIRSSPLTDITEVLGKGSYLGWVDPTTEPLNWKR